MICYDRFWKLLKDKGISQYRIVQSGISHSTLTRLKRNEGVSTDTLEKLCSILNCKIEDIIEYKREEHP